MHQNNQKTQQDACLVCGQPLLKDISLIHLINNYSLCLSCMKKFEILNWKFYFNHYHLTILYLYNDFFKTLLFQYKGQYDYLLKDVFVDLYKQEFNQRYKDYIIVPIPSSKEDNQVRGFAPMKEIALTFSTHLFLGLYKKQKYKQSDMPYHLRNQNNDLLSIHQGNQLLNKKICSSFL